jgi:putative FmdB family regulatory protein
MYSFRCKKCEEEFETLVSGSAPPTCPSCDSAELDRLLSAPAIGGKNAAGLARVRAQAAKEGHFSNYSKAELKGKK